MKNFAYIIALFACLVGCNDDVSPIDGTYLLSENHCSDSDQIITSGEVENLETWRISGSSARLIFVKSETKNCGFTRVYKMSFPSDDQVDFTFERLDIEGTCNFTSEEEAALSADRSYRYTLSNAVLRFYWETDPGEEGCDAWVRQ